MKHKVAKADDLETDGSRVIAEVEGQEIAVIRYDGKLHAIANYCIHQSGPLCEGPITGEITLAEDGWGWEFENEGKIVMCPWHRWKFDLTNGKNIDNDRYTVPTYDVLQKDGEIYVDV